MKTHITAIALALASLTTFAQQSNANVAAQRIEVLGATVGAAPVEFSRSGEHASMPVYTMAASNVTRAQVRAELMAYLASGERSRNRSGEKASMPDHAMTASTLSRAEVRADTVAFNSYASNRYFNDPKGGR